MGVVAGDDGAVVGQQCLHCSRRDGDAPVVEHHHADVLNRDGPFCILFERLFQFVGIGLPQHQLGVAEAEVDRVAEVEGLFDHRLIFSYGYDLADVIDTYFDDAS